MRKFKVTSKQYQAPSELCQARVTRRVASIAHRADAQDRVPGTHVTLEELHGYQLLGRRLQARATAAALGSLFRALLWPFRNLARVFAQAGREAAAVRQLGALDDHLLEDIGIRRDQIPALAAGLATQPAQPHTHPRPTARVARGERPAGCNDAHTKAAA